MARDLRQVCKRSSIEASQELDPVGPATRRGGRNGKESIKFYEAYRCAKLPEFPQGLRSQVGFRIVICAASAPRVGRAAA